MKDVDGRPLGENGAPASAKQGVEFSFRACPYSGHRRGIPMNVSALGQMTNHWDEARADIAFMRRAYLEHWSVDSFTLFDVWRFATLVTLLPAFLAQRSAYPLGDGQIPSRVATTFKLLLGASTAGMWLMFRRRMAPETPISLEEFLSYVEEERLLINSTTSLSILPPSDLEACAGPPHMFRDIFQTVLVPAPGDGTSGALRELLGNVQAWLGFGRAMIRMILGWASFQIGNLDALRRCTRLALAPTLHTALQETCDTCEVDIPSGKMKPGPMIDPKREGPLFQRLLTLELGSAWPPSRDGVVADEKDARELEKVLVDAVPGALGVGDLARLLADQLRCEREFLALFDDVRREFSTHLGERRQLPIDSRDLDAAYPSTLRKVVASWASIELRVDRRDWSARRAADPA